VNTPEPAVLARYDIDLTAHQAVGLAMALTSGNRRITVRVRDDGTAELSTHLRSDLARDLDLKETK